MAGGRVVEVEVFEGVSVGFGPIVGDVAEEPARPGAVVAVR